MKRLFASVTLALASLAWAVPAAAKDFVQDQASMFSADTVAALNQKISAFNTGTGKEIVVMTVPSLNGSEIRTAAGTAFTQQSVNGILIFIAKDDRKDLIVPDRDAMQPGWFTPASLAGIRTQMESQFKTENFDAGITGAVDGLLAVYRQHLSGSRSGSAAANPGTGSSFTMPSFQGVHISMFMWIIIFIIGFFVIRAIIRAISGPRYYGGGGMPGGMPMGGGMGGGYGPGMYGGGGGGFFSGLLGGLGGAWLGNEMFGNRGGGDVAGGAGGGVQGNDPSGAGWSNDAGQADMSGSSGGDWSGGGFGDSGGGGGFDSGGGGSDSGGGW